MEPAFDQLIRQLSAVYDEGEARSIARIVFEDTLHTRDYRNYRLSALEQELLDAITSRLLAGEPLQYILGEADFYGLKWFVGPDVLIPRQETEALVALALEMLKNRGWATPRVLDIGTGSGCIPVTIRVKMPSAQVSALDISPGALEIARKNALRHRADVTFLLLDILQTESWSGLGMFDLVISNPPYIPLEEMDKMSPGVIRHEPHLALFVPDKQPYLFYEKIADFALQHLCSGGALLFEVNEFRAAGVVQLLREKGFQQVTLLRDLAGADRMVSAYKP